MRKTLAILLILSIAYCYPALAQGEGVFDPGVAAIAPPPPPAEGDFIVALRLLDYSTKALLNETHATIRIIGQDEVETIQYINRDGTARIALDSGSYRIILKVDDTSTPGKDYYYSSAFTVSSNITSDAYMMPVGSVRGIVQDKGGNAVRSAQLKFECAGDYGEKQAARTDAFGSFASYWLPVGSCRINAAYKGMAGFADVNVSQGSLTNVDISLNGRILSEGFGAYSIFALIIIVMALLYFYYRKKPQVSSQPKQRTIVIKRAEQHPRTTDIMRTLNPKERKIAEYLLENNGKSTQAYIRNATGLPKTTLARALMQLEGKRVVQIETIGKMKKVALTPWFSGKE